MSVQLTAKLHAVCHSLGRGKMKFAQNLSGNEVVPEQLNKILNRRKILGIVAIIIVTGLQELS